MCRGETEALQSHTHSPVDGRGASLGFTAEDHLPVPLQSLNRIHDAARLLGEDRTLQDAARCRTTRNHTRADYYLKHGPFC